jgi:hypothetical protein
MLFPVGDLRRIKTMGIVTKKVLTEEEKWPGKKSPITMLRDFAHCYDGVTQTKYEKGKTYEHYGDSLLAALRNESKPVATFEGETLGLRPSPLAPIVETPNPLATFLEGMNVPALKDIAVKKGIDATGLKREELIAQLLKLGQK